MCGGGVDRSLLKGHAVRQKGPSTATSRCEAKDQLRGVRRCYSWDRRGAIRDERSCCGTMRSTRAAVSWWRGSEDHQKEGWCNQKQSVCCFAGSLKMRIVGLKMYRGAESVLMLVRA